MQRFPVLQTSVRLAVGAPLIVLALTFTLGACRGDQSAAPQAVSADTWATVDGRAITRDDVEKAFRRSQDPAAPISPEEAMTVKLSILNEMILQDILLAKARDLKIEVTDSELDAAYTERKANLTDAQFEEELKKRNLTAADMRETLRRELLTNKLIEQEVTSKVTVSDQEVTDFFNANRAQFTVPEESYRLAQIVVTPNDEPQQANRTGNDATTEQEAAFKVRMIMERLKGGASFADLAMDYSEDPETAARGGDLGLVPVSALKQAPPALRNAVIGKEPGTVTAASAGGIHTIIVVLGHEPAGERDLSTPGVRDAITEGLKTRKEQLLRTAYLSSARGDANVVNHQARRIVESQGKVQ
ncbi:MAG TPA: SurA N-terminal domain-containing protein [Vicinamibacterales bacterium]|nr:SurA N-terminal domain-containing protein [Vicinamibacterales bacterium]